MLPGCRRPRSIAPSTAHTDFRRGNDGVTACKENFRFSVKLPKQITHVRKLVDCQVELDDFLEQANVLGAKLGVLLVQLPPKHVFDPDITRAFFKELAAQSGVQIACEPRHASWFTSPADELLSTLCVVRVAADPPICEAAEQPGGWRGLSYWRLHGSPVIYRSSYGDRIRNSPSNSREPRQPAATFGAYLIIPLHRRGLGMPCA